ncbi:protein stoned-A-like [Oratosquilla oratoria]|uniref:protein stoned-A-like n=1 Tax=Oratosquilla oratoria TaxID=337810 RepID=UPI003F767DB2
MHKIKKGIKKKVKGKKGKNDELFTEEELKAYKARKEEEARRLAEEQQQREAQSADSEGAQLSTESAAAAAVPSVDGVSSSGGAAAAAAAAGASTAETPTTEQESTKPKDSSDSGGAGGDWRSFLSATDTVLKQTTEHLEQIKETSYFQHKKAVEEEVEQKKAPSPVPPPRPKWVDLEKGGIDDEEKQEVESKEEAADPEAESEPVVLQPLEDLPNLDEEEYTDIFDTTYVDNIESGHVKLHYIPDSPTTEDPNEPDPFDTSAVDKVLHTEEPKPLPKQEPPKPKKQKKLVSLGCAVEVLTGKASTEEAHKQTTKDSKRRRVVPQIDLLRDFEDLSETSSTEGEKEKTESSEEQEGVNRNDKNILNRNEEAVEVPVDDLLFPVSPSDKKSSEKDDSKDDLEDDNKGEVDLSEFLDSESAKDKDSPESKENKQDLDIKDLVAEFDIIDASEVTNESLIPSSEPDPIEDEFDAEFAVLAAESVAKAKDKAIDELGELDEDDPFDTSAAVAVLGAEEQENEERDPFDVSFVDEHIGTAASDSPKPSRPPPPRPAQLQQEVNEKEAFDLLNDDQISNEEEVDPFDTSLAAKVLPVDHFEIPDTEGEVGDTLKPQAGGNIKTSESFDPFDTSIAESFGKTELKVLEDELLGSKIPQNQQESLKHSESDFEFNPREGEEPSSAPKRRSPPSCLLTAPSEDVSGPFLAPLTADANDEVDPFDTSIADKIHQQVLEEEFLYQNNEESEAKLQKPKKPPPRPASPTALLTSSPNTDINPLLQPAPSTNDAQAEEFDPFDTSIADQFGKTELKVLESELLSQETKTIVCDEESKKAAATPPKRPSRPPSPACFLGASPQEETLSLHPVLQPSEKPVTNEVEYDPFDTSIADQFGQTELKVLEGELLTANEPPVQPKVAQEFEDKFDFDPRSDEAKAPIHGPQRPPRPASPCCLLAASPAEENLSLQPVLPASAAPTTTQEPEVFDPFDTSIADRYSTTELKVLEKQLLSPVSDKLPKDSGNSVKEENQTNRPPPSPKPSRPPRPTAAPTTCVFATTPGDTNPALQPFAAAVQEPQPADTAEDYDPFDTSIADKFGKTEIKALEQELLAKEAPPDFDGFNPRADRNTQAKPFLKPLPVEPVAPVTTADSLLATTPSAESLPSLQPVASVPVEDPEDFDPFDTSIADTFGKTELKVLESELISETSLKRNLNSDDFDPRASESKAPKRPPVAVAPAVAPVAAPVTSLLDADDGLPITQQPATLQPQGVPGVSDIADDFDPFDTSAAKGVLPGKAELKVLESELLSSSSAAEIDPFDTSKY